MTCLFYNKIEIFEKKNIHFASYFLSASA